MNVTAKQLDDFFKGLIAADGSGAASHARDIAFLEEATKSRQFRSMVNAHIGCIQSHEANAAAVLSSMAIAFASGIAFAQYVMLEEMAKK